MAEAGTHAQSAQFGVVSEKMANKMDGKEYQVAECLLDMAKMVDEKAKQAAEEQRVAKEKAEQEKLQNKPPTDIKIPKKVKVPKMDMTPQPRQMQPMFVSNPPVYQAFNQPMMMDYMPQMMCSTPTMSQMCPDGSYQNCQDWQDGQDGSTDIPDDHQDDSGDDSEPEPEDSGETGKS